MQAAWIKRGSIYFAHCGECGFKASALSPGLVTEHMIEHIWSLHPGRI